ncbi:MAG: hypothetical protein EOM21_13650 [Gammaproteobacteria bacterium]|nr:hypothetical protein [Gammaproteobacteria bacterium]
MSVPPGWILKAIAGAGNDVAWSGIDPTLCRFITRTVTTPMYPLEVYEEMAASAAVLGGWGIEVQREAFTGNAVLTAGEIVKVYEPVEFTQAPEAFTGHAILTDGLIYTVYNPVAFTQAPESFTGGAVLTSGLIWGGVLAQAPVESMETSLIEVTGEFG